MLPSKIVFYCKPSTENGVYHAFPVDSEAKHDTAKTWATESSGQWFNGSWERTKVKEPVVFEFDNSNFDNVIINDLDKRGNGGRAYQVILARDGNLFRVDLREDTLMDVIRNTGIQAGGKLNGTFCFIKEAAQTNLVREGTERHERAKAEAEKKATHTTNIKKSDLKPGYLYSTVSGDQKIFLGHVYSRSIDKHDGSIGKPYKAMLFIDSWDVGGGTLKMLRTGELEDNRDSILYWRLKVMKSHSLRIEGVQKIIDVDLEKFVKHINAFGQHSFEEKMDVKYKGHYWLDEAIDCYELAHFKVNKEDLDFQDSEGKRIVDIYRRRNNRW